MSHLTIPENRAPGAFRSFLETTQRVIAEGLDGSEATVHVCAGEAFWSLANLPLHQNNASICAPITLRESDIINPITRMLLLFDEKQQLDQLVNSLMTPAMNEGRAIA